MVTEDFEEWLRRQDIPITETVSVDRYLDYLKEEFGIHGASLDVAEDIYHEKYDYFYPLGIRPIERHYKVEGEPMVETRYGISGYPGLWGYEKTLEIALRKAEELEWEEAVIWLREKRRLGE